MTLKVNLKGEEDEMKSKESCFDSFVPADWAAYSKMLDAHERAAWLEGYRAAKNEQLREIVQKYGKEKGE